MRKWSKWNMISEQEVISLYCLLCFPEYSSVRWDPRHCHPPPPVAYLMDMFSILAADIFISKRARKAFVVVLDIFNLHYCRWLSAQFRWSTLRLWNSSANNRWRLEAAGIWKGMRIRRVTKAEKERLSSESERLKRTKY